MTTEKQTWENSDLIRRLCSVLDIAKLTVEHLAAEGFSHPDDSDNKIQPEKIIGETAYLMLSASYLATNTNIKYKLHELAAILIPYARNDKTLVNICLHPALAFDYAYAHICLTKLGYPDHKFEALLAATLTASCHNGHERTPYRMIEQAWIKKIWNKGYKSVDKITSYTLVANPIDLINGTRDDMYAFTHALVYVSDLYNGAAILPRATEAILDEADVMLAKCMDEQDYDLTGELLLSWPYVNHCWSATSIFAFNVIADIEDTCGFLPSPTIQNNIPPSVENVNRKKYLYASAYHTIYVMGLLCSAILRYNRNPPKRISKTDMKPGSAEKILPFLINNGNPHWMPIFGRLSVHEQDAIAPFLFNIAIFRNIRYEEYGKVYEILKTGHKLGITNTALASQTAQFLERINELSKTLKKQIDFK